MPGRKISINQTFLMIHPFSTRLMWAGILADAPREDTKTFLNFSSEMPDNPEVRGPIV